jgi:hypothetical protein
MAPTELQDRRSLRSRELQDASRRSQPIADSALFQGAALTITRLETENQQLRDELEAAMETVRSLDTTASWMDGAA